MKAKTLMPLLHKPRDPSFGVRRVRRKPNRRKMLQASILPETQEYLDAKCNGTAPGHLIDEAMKLHVQFRHELSPYTSEAVKRVPLSTPVSPDTLAYVHFMRSAMTPGELIDDAIRLHKQVHEQQNAP